MVSKLMADGYSVFFKPTIFARISLCHYILFCMLIAGIMFIGNSPEIYAHEKTIGSSGTVQKIALNYQDIAQKKYEKIYGKSKKKSDPFIRKGWFHLNEHPRLLFSNEDQERIKKNAEKDGLLSKLIGLLVSDAESMLKESYPSQFSAGRYRKRPYVANVQVLALAYRFTKDDRFLLKAKNIMLKTAALRHWNADSKFLTTSSVIISMSLGYDWLYEQLSDREREIIENAIINKGLLPGLKFYEGRGVGETPKWPKVKHNWNFVCNAGMGIGALAIADKERELSGRILEYAIPSFFSALSSYDPDGNWMEGPSYWDYATLHAAAFLDVLDTAASWERYNLSEYVGFGKTGLYRIYVTGPTGLYFNYADSSDRPNVSQQMFWLSKVFKRSEYTDFLKRELKKRLGTRPASIHKGHFPGAEIIWYERPADRKSYMDLPLDYYSRGFVDIITMRSDWSADALYLGIRAGRNGAHHGHFDIGSFVLDAEGLRWAIDPPKKIRLKSVNAHNTLSFNMREQFHKGVGKVIDYQSRPERVHVVIDMRTAYGRRSPIGVLRGVAMIDRKYILMQDEITNMPPGTEMRWKMMTPASVELQGNKAILRQKGRRVEAYILQPKDAIFEKLELPKRKKHKMPKGHTILGVRIKGEQYKNFRLAILLIPKNSSSQKVLFPKIMPLKKWSGYGKKQKNPMNGVSLQELH